jgi:hypothetical protein
MATSAPAAISWRRSASVSERLFAALARVLAASMERTMVPTGADTSQPNSAATCPLAATWAGWNPESEVAQPEASGRTQESAAHAAQ